MIPLSMCIIPKFYTMDGEGMHNCNGSDSTGTEKILQDRDFLVP